MTKVHWTKELLETIVPECYSYAEVLRRVGLKTEGSNPKTLQKYLHKYNIDFSHFTGKKWNTNKNNPVYRKKLLPALTEHSSLKSFHVKKHLYNLGIKENKCDICGISEWMNKPLVCELHHINGDTTDNRIENLIILCPNCHSQTDTFRNKHKRT